MTDRQIDSGYRILLIDDDLDFSNYQSTILENSGYTVRTASSAAQAMQIRAEFQPQLALIDLVLEGENGIDVLDALLTVDPQICCLMITGRETIESALLALRHGAVDYLSKSVSTDELLKAIERATEKVQLRQEKQVIEYANKAKSEFLARMSHELRTPLNAILGFGQLLQLDDENLNEEQVAGIDHILVAGRHLLQLINEVLDISKVDVGEMSLSIESISFKDVLESALLLVKPLATKHSVIIDPVDSSTCCSVMADLQRLKQVFVNLLSNAVKYNRQGGQVYISCRQLECVDSDTAMIRIEISDTGVGIKREDFQKVFEPFQRISLRGENIEGSGIGLTISKKMTELMAGSIGFESEYGKGSTFWIELPSAEACATDRTVMPAIPERAPRETPSAQAKVILYIEDNPANFSLIESLLKKHRHYTLLSANTAERGIDVAKDQQPDLILLDIDLPGMDGYEALDILSVHKQTAHIPVVAVSAHAMPEHIKQGRQSAFKEYVTKPIEVDALLRVLEQY